MNRFPLVRIKLSNEHIMTGLFIVLIMYLIPAKADIIEFIVVVGVALFIDTVANFIKYSKASCGVSAAITAGILLILLPEVSLVEKLLVITVALIIGKHLFGGTGKNIFNPAIVGLLLACVFFGVNSIYLAGGVYLIPAMILSLPFLKFRPFAGVALIVGMVLSMILTGDFTISYLISSGAIFLGCLVMTDPVTMTLDPIVGMFTGFVIGFTSMYFFDDVLLPLVIGILVVNVTSYMIDKYSKKVHSGQALSFHKGIIKYSEDTAMVDLTTENNSKKPLKDVSLEKFLNIIKNKNIVGMGGAGFSTYTKISALLESNKEKHLIINGVECDPGLIHDKWLMDHKFDEINQGIEVLTKLIEFKTVNLAVKEYVNVNKSQYIHKVKDYYPNGAEKLLIKDVLKVDLKDLIPAKEGVLVLNVQTVYSIYEAVYKNNDSNTRFITMADLRDNTAIVAKVAFGHKVNELIKQVNITQGIVFTGGGLMQSKVSDEDCVVDYTTNFIAVSEFPRYKESNLCSKCGQCELRCPAKLKVRHITDYIKANKIEEALKLNASTCIECGSCSYVCPAGRNLSSVIQSMKKSKLNS